MKTIEVSSQRNLGHWDYYLQANALHGPWGPNPKITDIEAARTALAEFKRIILRQRSVTSRYTVPDNSYYYTVPEQSWTLYVLTHPVAMEMFQVVNNENN